MYCVELYYSQDVENSEVAGKLDLFFCNIYFAKLSSGPDWIPEGASSGTWAI